MRQSTKWSKSPGFHPGQCRFDSGLPYQCPDPLVGQASGPSIRQHGFESRSGYFAEGVWDAEDTDIPVTSRRVLARFE